MDGDDAEVLWPFRTINDKMIRKQRMRDVRIYAILTKQQILLEQILSYSYYNKWDYIHTLNFSFYCLLLSKYQFFEFYYSYFLDLNTQDYIDKAKALNNALKSGAVLRNYPGTRYHFYELLNLVGFRNLPFPGFDIVEETEKLCSSNGRDEVSKTNFLEFDSTVKQIFNDTTLSPVNITFLEYVKTHEWAKTGSANYGYTYIMGKKIKNRKNMLPFLKPDDHIAQQAIDYKEQENWSIVKNETGKLRIATAADFLTHVQMSYFDYISQHYYIYIKNVDLEKNLSDSMKQTTSILSDLKNNYSLPFDFEGFDHQPTLTEIISIVYHYTQPIIYALKPEIASVAQTLQNNIITGFNNSLLKLNHNKTLYVFKIKSGLMSGLKWTSMIGNVWNKAYTTMVLRRMPVSPITYFIKGDDTLLIFKTYLLCLMAHLLYSLFRIKSGFGKFAVLYEKGEFLRIEYDAERQLIHSYPARTMPTLIQRKPWNSAPLFNQLYTTQLPHTQTLMRRLEVDDSDLLRTIKATTRLSFDFISSPTFTNGLGFTTKPLSTYTVYKKTTPYKQINLDGVSLNSTNHIDQLNASAQLFGLELQPLHYYNYSYQSLSTIITDDDIPGLSKIDRAQLGRKTSVSRGIKLACPHFPDLFDSYYYQLDSFKNLDYTTDKLGSCASLQPIVDAHRQLTIAGLRELNLIQKLRTSNIYFDNQFSNLSKKHLSAQVIIDLLIFSKVSLSTSILPALVSYTTSFCCDLFYRCTCAKGLSLRLHVYNNSLLFADLISKHHLLKTLFTNV